MLASLLDNLIAPFSPMWALRRASARAALRTYQAADRGRRNKDWATASRSADASIIPDAGTINPRSRGMVRDSHIAKSIVRSKVRNIIGRGITPVPTAVDINGNELVDLNRAAEKGFWRWANKRKLVDAERRRNFWGMQRLAIAEAVTVGEAIFVMGYIPGQGPQIRAYEAEQFDTTLQQFNGNEVRGGVEVDAGGAAVAYHLWARNPNDYLSPKSLKSTRIEEFRVIHYYDPERVMQARGVSELAPVLQRIRDVHKRDEAELMKSVMEACHGASIIRARGRAAGSAAGMPRAPGDPNASTPGDLPKFEYVPGMVFEGEPGDEIKFHAPTTPGNGYEPFARGNLRGIGAGVGLSYEQVARDFSLSSWSSQRQALLEDRREWNPIQDHIADLFIAPVYEFWFRCAVLEGRLPLTAIEFARDPEQYTEAEYVPDGHEWVDPEKEVNAIEKGLNLKILTRKEVVSRRGGRLRKTLEQIKAEDVLAGQLGLSFTNAATPAQAATMPNEGTAPATPPAATPATPPPGNSGDAVVAADGSPEAGIVASQTLNGAQITSAVDVMGKVSAGQLTAFVAVELLVSLGFPREKAQSMVNDATKVPPPPPPPPQQP